MSVTIDQRRKLRAIAHNLKPVVMVSENGISEGLVTELERALSDHELIKVKIAIADRETRGEVARELCNLGRAELIQSIGKVAILYRASPKPNPKLSNVLRAQAGKL